MFKKAQEQGIALVILGIVAIVAVIGLVLLFSGVQLGGSGAVPFDVDDDDDGGTDTIQTTAVMTLDTQIGLVAIPLQGAPGTIVRSPPDPNTGIIQTEIVEMELVGNSPLGPVTVRIGAQFGLPPTTGTIIPTLPPDEADYGEEDYQGEVIYNAFIEANIGNLPTFQNLAPMPIQAPFVGTYFEETHTTPPGHPPVDLFDPLGNPSGVFWVGFSGVIQPFTPPEVDDPFDLDFDDE